LRERARSIIVYAAALLFAVALVHRFIRLGGPYFEFPKTVQDHVAPVPYPSRDMILLAGRATRIIPRGATVTAIEPSQAPDYDPTLYLTAAGMMPRHRVIAPLLTPGDHAALPDYVLAVRLPLSHPAYHLFRTLPEGRIYEATR
jgi:hypothetical protein